MECFGFRLLIFLAVAHYSASYNNFFVGNSYYILTPENNSFITAHKKQWNATIEKDTPETNCENARIWKVSKNRKDPGYLKFQNEMVPNNTLSGFSVNPKNIYMETGRIFPEIGMTWQLQTWHDDMANAECLENDGVGNPVMFTECKDPLKEEALSQIWILRKVENAETNQKVTA